MFDADTILTTALAQAQLIDAFAVAMGSQAASVSGALR
jgi:hypothetical protein